MDDHGKSQKNIPKQHGLTLFCRSNGQNGGLSQLPSLRAYLALMHYSCYQLQGHLLGYEAMLSGSTLRVLACDVGRYRPYRRSFFPQGSLVFVVFYMVFYGVPKLRMHFRFIF